MRPGHLCGTEYWCERFHNATTSLTRLGRLLVIFQKWSISWSRTALELTACLSLSCSLQCAILSPAFKVREFSITDVVAYPISLKWNSAAEEGVRYAKHWCWFAVFHIKKHSIDDNVVFNTCSSWLLRQGSDSVIDWLHVLSSDCEVFPKNHAAPFSKVLTFYRKEPFSLEAYYNCPKDLPYPDPTIGKYNCTKFSLPSVFLFSRYFTSFYP